MVPGLLEEEAEARQELNAAPVSVAVEAGQAEALAAAAGGATAMAGLLEKPVKVCELSELAEGCGKLVTVGGKPVSLFRLGERVIATSAECPHEGGPLQDGTIEGGCVVCPWHSYKFDLASGRCEDDAGLKLEAYSTTVENGTVFVEMRA